MSYCFLGAAPLPRPVAKSIAKANVANVSRLSVAGVQYLVIFESPCQLHCTQVCLCACLCVCVPVCVLVCVCVCANRGISFTQRTLPFCHAPPSFFFFCPNCSFSAAGYICLLPHKSSNMQLPSNCSYLPQCVCVRSGVESRVSSLT